MKVTVSVDVGPSPDPIALEQMFTWAARLEEWMKNLPSRHIAPVVSTAPVVEDRPQTNGAADPNAVASEAGTTAEAAQDTAADTTTQPTEKRKRGRPPARTAETAAAAMTEPQTPAVEQPAPAAPAGAMPPGVSVALPPGVAMTQPSQPVAEVQATTQPAMPKVEPAGEGDAVSYEDLRACYVQVNAKNPKIAFKIMHGAQWGDGSPKDKWFTLENVPADMRERLMGELASAAI